MRTFSIWSVLLLAVPAAGMAQTSAAAGSKPPVNFTAEQDHQNMMDQLGILLLRPGRSGDAKGPNPANYDESQANPYPDLPDALTLNDGRKVTSAAMWWKQRRPQIVEAYSKDVYGIVPATVPQVRWAVRTVDRERIGFTPVVAKDVIGTVDNAADPDIKVRIHMTLVTPEAAKGPVPVLMMFGPAGFPAPNEPNEEEFARINAAWRAVLVEKDPSLAAVFAEHPAWEPVKKTPFAFPQLNADGGLPNTWQLAADRWGFALLDPASIQADDGAGLTQGIIGLTNHGQPRTPEQWGALRAWAWGAGRALDYLETDAAVDAKHVGIEGVSRYGKAALVTMAFDERFAMVLVGSSGKGGATPLRRSYGEAVENLTGGEYYWMAGNFMKYGASKIRVGDRVESMNPGEIPVDSNELIALCAPRLTFISYGVPEKGDAHWLDHRGSWMATADASRVWTLLGARGLGGTGFTVGADYHTAPMPPVNTGLVEGELAWRQHDGGHTEAPNMTYFLAWADKWIKPVAGSR